MKIVRILIRLASIEAPVQYYCPTAAHNHFDKAAIPEPKPTAIQEILLYPCLYGVTFEESLEIGGAAPTSAGTALLYVPTSLSFL
jgi:hypothetical protein